MSDKKENVENEVLANDPLKLRASRLESESDAQRLQADDSADPNPGLLHFTGGPAQQATLQDEREKKQAAEEAAKQAKQGAEYAQRLWDYVKRDPAFPHDMKARSKEGFRLSCSYAHFSKCQSFINFCGTPPNQATIQEVEFIIRNKPKEGKWEKFLNFVFGQDERVKIAFQNGKIHVEGGFAGEHPSIEGTVNACRTIALKEQEMVIAQKMKEVYGEDALKNPTFNYAQAREKLLKELPEDVKKEIFSFEINKLNNSKELGEMLVHMKKDPALNAQLSKDIYEKISNDKELKGLTAEEKKEVTELLAREAKRHGVKREPEPDTDNTLNPKAGGTQAEQPDKLKPR